MQAEPTGLGIPARVDSPQRLETIARMAAKLKALGTPQDYLGWLAWVKLAIPLLRLARHNENPVADQYLFRDLSNSASIQEMARIMSGATVAHDDREGREIVHQWCIDLLNGGLASLPQNLPEPALFVTEAVIAHGDGTANAEPE